MKLLRIRSESGDSNRLLLRCVEGAQAPDVGYTHKFKKNVEECQMFFSVLKWAEKFQNCRLPEQQNNMCEIVNKRSK